MLVQLRVFLVAAAVAAACSGLDAAVVNVDITVWSSRRIDSDVGGFTLALATNARFGSAVANIGDVDNDGFADLAVGAPNVKTSTNELGSVFILYMKADATVKSSTKESAIDLTVASNGDGIGSSLASIAGAAGGFEDLVVGAPFDEDNIGSEVDVGAIWTTGVYIKRFRSEENGVPIMSADDRFGSSIAALDINGDFFRDLVVGAPGRDANGLPGSGALLVLFSVDPANKNANPSSIQEINALNFSGLFNEGDSFGSSVCSMGDIDGDLVPDLAVGAIGDDNRTGAVWILFLNRIGTVKSQQKISNSFGNFKGTLSGGDRFGASVAKLADLNGDSIPELVVGASGDDTDGSDAGALWILFLNRNGTVKLERKITGIAGLLPGNLFGSAVASLEHNEGPGAFQLVVGAPQYLSDTTGAPRGTLFIVLLNITVDEDPAASTTGFGSESSGFSSTAVGTTGSASSAGGSTGQVSSTTKVTEVPGTDGSIDTLGTTAQTTVIYSSAGEGRLDAATVSPTADSNTTIIVMMVGAAVILVLLGVVSFFVFRRQRHSNSKSQTRLNEQHEGASTDMGPGADTGADYAMTPGLVGDGRRHGDYTKTPNLGSNKDNYAKTPNLGSNEDNYAKTPSFGPNEDNYARTPSYA